jgi:hypothetical protein
MVKSSVSMRVGTLAFCSILAYIALTRTARLSAVRRYLTTYSSRPPILNTDEVLERDDYLMSVDGKLVLYMQNNGVFLYRTDSSGIIPPITIATGRNDLERLIMKGSGNLVIISSSGIEAFETGTSVPQPLPSDSLGPLLIVRTLAEGGGAHIVYNGAIIWSNGPGGFRAIP